MAKRKKAWEFTAEHKLRILEKAREPNTTVAEVLRRHQVGRDDVLSLGA